MSRIMKDSGIEWIGKIPEEWKLEKLKHSVVEINEKNSPVKFTNVLSLTKEKGVLPYEDKGNQGNKSKEDITQYKIAYKDTIVANSMNIIIGSVGISNYDGCVSPVYYVFKNTVDSELRFIYYLLTTTEFQKQMRRFANGILEIRLRISSENLMGQKIPLPSKTEQKKIADFLDEKIREIDNVIETTKATIEDYKKYKQSVITETVTKGLNPDVEMKDSGVDWIGNIPEHWEITKVKFLYNIILGKMLCNEPKDETYTLENYLCSQNIKWNGIDTTTIKKMWFSEQEKSLYLLNEGDLVITEGGSIGESCIYKGEYAPCYIQNAVHKATGRGKNKNKLLYYWLQTLETVGYFNVICNRATIAHYTKEKVENTPIIHIPQDEQEEIVEFLDKKCTEIDNLISAKEQLIADMESYKKSLIYEYVTGKKEVE